MTKAQEMHKKDLDNCTKAMDAVHDPLVTANYQKAIWWDIKNKMGRYEIAYGQALNLAVQMAEARADSSIDIWHAHFYQLLTEPYRGSSVKVAPAKKVLPDGEVDFGGK